MHQADTTRRPDPGCGPVSAFGHTLRTTQPDGACDNWTRALADNAQSRGLGRCSLRSEIAHLRLTPVPSREQEPAWGAHHTSAGMLNES